MIDTSAKVYRRFLASSAVALLMSTAAYAQWLVGATIDRIQLTPTGDVVLYVGSAHECGGTRLQFQPDSSLADAAARDVKKMAYAGLLAAQAQNKPVNFFITGCVATEGRFANFEE